MNMINLTNTVLQKHTIHCKNFIHTNKGKLQIWMWSHIHGLHLESGLKTNNSGVGLQIYDLDLGLNLTLLVLTVCSCMVYNVLVLKLKIFTAS